MNNFDKFDEFYMNTALNVAKLSYCERRKVGAVIVDKDKNNILSFGYNGTPSGEDNVCEIDNLTKPEVIHAEVNAIAKVAKSNNSTEGCTMYITLSPCVDCAKVIIQSGIKTVYYLEEYKSKKGLELLEKTGIEVILFS